MELKTYKKSTEAFKDELMAARQDNSELVGIIDNLEQELKKIKEELRSTRASNNEIEERCHLLQSAKEEMYRGNRVCGILSDTGNIT